MSNLRLKNVAILQAGGTPRVDDPAMWSDDDSTGMPWMSIGDMLDGGIASSASRRVSHLGLLDRNLPIGKAGTVLFAMYASVGSVTELGIEATWNQAILGMTVEASRANQRFLYYWLQSLRTLLPYSYRSNTQDNLNAEQVGNLPFANLSVGKQALIADYLDVETARIDALIAKKQRMMELLEERLKVELVRLVLGDDERSRQTGSVSGMYPSVPVGWAETTLRHLGCSVQTGPFGSQLHAEEYMEGGWPVVNLMNLIDGGIARVESMTISEAKRQELQRHVLKAGDVVFGRRGEMGRAGLVNKDHVGWLCGTGSLRLRLKGSPLEPEYLLLLLRTPPARAYFELASVGSTMDNLNSEIVLAFPCFLPPKDVQLKIVQEMRRGTDLVVTALDRLEHQIDLLSEHRQALITAAVTGQLDIPEVANGNH
ncbi:MAG: restriction endonuclease subunit S [Acidimicrobiales bacterium]